MSKCRAIAMTVILPAGMVLALHATAQTVESTSMAVDRLNALTRSNDQEMIRNAGTSVRKVESSVQDVFVAYKPRHDSEMRRVGVPLVSSADTGLGLAYDLSGKNLMAQWKFSQSNLGGGSVNYRAFVSETGQVSFTVSSNF